VYDGTRGDASALRRIMVCVTNYRKTCPAETRSAALSLDAARASSRYRTNRPFVL